MALRRIISMCSIALMSLLMLNSCNKEDQGYGESGGDIPTNYVVLKDGTISPSVLTLVAGNNITFLNQTGEVHQVISSDSVSINTGIIQPYRSYTWSKDIDGTFQVRCVQHPNERAIITMTP